jgi:hypothetical protein
MDDLLGQPIPRESRATCEDCAMCAPSGGAEAATLYFNPRIKCCTYVPRLPNYLVGSVLADGDAASSAGRATVEQRIDAGVGVTPLGLERSKVYELLYDNGMPAFGRAESMRCPHYVEEAGGRCGIWRHRNAVCATWFCKYERGSVGVAFWDRLRDLLMVVEADLAAWCVLESNLDETAIGASFPDARRPDASDRMGADDLDGRADPDLARKLWGNWLGREREFYRECARRIRSLSWEDVLRIAGPVVAARARIARRAFGALLHDDPPERLTAGPIQIISQGKAGARVVTYSSYDPLDLTPAVLEILPYFDGRSTIQACAQIQQDLGVQVSADLVRKLSDFEVLVPPKQTTV